MHRLALSVILAALVAVPLFAQERPSSVVRKIGTDVVNTGTDGDIYLTGAPSPYTTAGVFIRANGTSFPDVSAKLGNNTSAASFSMFNSSDTLLMRVRGDGMVGINESTPLAALHVTHNANAATGLRLNNTNTGTAASTSISFSEGATVKGTIGVLGANYAFVPNAFVIWNATNAPMLIGTNSVEIIRVDPLRRVGVNVGNPSTELDVNSTATTAARGITSSQFSTDTNAAVVIARKARGTSIARTTVTNGDATGEYTAMGYDGTDFVGGGRIRFAVDSTVATNNVPTSMQFFTGATGFGSERMRITSAGNVGIGESNPTEKLVVSGNVVVTGSITGATVINATYQDVAEWVPATTRMEPGTVVVLNRTRNNEVMPSGRSYDTAVAGVVSRQPGVILGVASDSKAQIATTGRVHVHVDATAGPIAIGDLLVTSDKTGTAMKSQPVDVAGVQFHRPGTVIGKALEPLASGEGEILVLLSLQ